MTDTSPDQVKTPLGVGTIVADSFSLLFGNIVSVALTCFVPIVIGLVISGSLIGFSAALGTADPSFVGGSGAVISFLVAMIVQIIIYGITIAALVQLAYDAKLGRAKDFGKYARAAIVTAVPNVLMMILVTILVGIASIFLLLPGLWVYAIYSVVVPALVIERVGLGALTRSRHLTREYRWPIAGALLLILICATILNMAAGFLAAFLAEMIGGGSVIVIIIMQALFFTLSYGITSISVALIYARLREIKEGASVDSLVSVFE